MLRYLGVDCDIGMKGNMRVVLLFGMLRENRTYTMPERKAGNDAAMYRMAFA